MNRLPDVPSTEAVRKFVAVYRFLRKYSRRMQGEGLSGRKVATLWYLCESGPLTIGQLRDHLFISDSSTSELVDRLERAGYVGRARSDSDNRVVKVTVTDAGREVVGGITLGGIPLLRERLRTLPSGKLSLVSEALDEIMQLLEIVDDSI